MGGGGDGNLKWVAMGSAKTDLDVGAVVRGSGDVRKVRWNRRGIGKNGGVMVLYFP